MKLQALVVIDIQKEYVSKDRPFFLKSIGTSLKNAKICLEWARMKKIPVIHVKHLQDGDVFSPQSPFSDFISGFAPTDSEKVAIKSNYSSFSSADFVSILTEYRDCELILVGYGTTMCVLTTAIEGYHLGYNMTVIGDATAAKKTERFDELSTHQYALDIMKPFAKIISTKDLIENT